MSDLPKRFVRSVKTRGLRNTLSAIKHRMLDGAPAIPAQRTDSGKLDVIGFYNNILGHKHGNPAGLAQVKANQIQWVIPNLGFGSGGHLNIFRFINMLAERGYEQHVVIVPPYSWSSANEAKATIAEWYFPLNATLSLGIDGFRPAAVTFATGWQTAYWVAKHQASAEKLYFVQDFEPMFSPVSSDYFFTENTYRLGLKGITAGDWLSRKLTSEYDMPCVPISFGVESMYQPKPRRPSDNFNILFYSRHVTPRRMFEMGLLALERVCREIPSAAVIFVGGDVGQVDIPFHHLNGGQQNLDALPDLYSQCDLSLVLSGTNLSLLPLELAACGCPVVMNDIPSTRWLLPEDAAFYAQPTPEALAEAMLLAIRNEEERRKRAERALRIARASSWEKEADRLIAGIATLTAKAG